MVALNNKVVEGRDEMNRHLELCRFGDKAIKLEIEDYEETKKEDIIETKDNGSQEREFYLMQKLTSLKKGSDSINEYIGKFKTICDELSATRRVVSDKDKVF
ncbi:hypothetical protein EJ110_NYTH35577 [Nymphaea thermarum]|nr:hypothetical protein EJ110_NYTH35577 [Nymphaea thermarum]